MKGYLLPRCKREEENENNEKQVHILWKRKLRKKMKRLEKVTN